MARSFRWGPFLPVRPEDTLLHVLLLLSKHRLKAVPVVDADSKSVRGFITQVLPKRASSSLGIETDNAPLDNTSEIICLHGIPRLCCNNCMGFLFMRRYLFGRFLQFFLCSCCFCWSQSRLKTTMCGLYLSSIRWCTKVVKPNIVFWGCAQDVAVQLLLQCEGLHWFETIAEQKLSNAG